MRLISDCILLTAILNLHSIYLRVVATSTCLATTFKWLSSSGRGPKGVEGKQHRTSERGSAQVPKDGISDPSLSSIISSPAAAAVSLGLIKSWPREWQPAAAHESSLSYTAQRQTRVVSSHPSHPLPLSLRDQTRRPGVSGALAGCVVRGRTGGCSMAAEAASAGDAGDSIFQQIHDRCVLCSCVEVCVSTCRSTLRVAP